MSIRIGTQLITPDGYYLLEKGITYYFLRSDSNTEQVFLVHFMCREPRAVTSKTDNRTKHATSIAFPVLLRVSRSHFEAGIDKKAIVLAEKQLTMPPWLEPLEGLNLAWVDDCRRNAKLRHADRLDNRLMHIYPLVQNMAAILQSNDPDQEINRHARACTPKQNETRIRLWFYLYILFGRNRFVLHYPVHRIGHWCRQQCAENKLGAPSPYRGKNHGFNVDAAMRQKIMDGYYRHCGLGVTMKFIYQRTMTTFFGCQAISGEHGRMRYVHPQGESFPTENQFRYHVEKEIGKKQIRQTLIGKVRERNEVLASSGTFTQQVGNLLEKAESDGYYFEEVPKGYIEGSPLPPLCMVRMRDFASGAIIGVGFSLNSERASAYLSALFCAAIGKVKFCSLFGIPIKEADWPSIGLPAHLVTDRGPGASDLALPSNTAFKPLLQELAPSYSGQSKAVVESSHPKSVSNKEAPNHYQSNLTPIEMIRREVYRVLKDNETINIGGRIAPEFAGKIRKPSPNALWTLLDSLGRNDGITMNFEDAIRNFLTPVKVLATPEAVYFHKRPYHSAALTESGLLQYVAESHNAKIQAYALEACVRHIWIEYRGRIIELDLQSTIRSNSAALYMSLEQLRALHQLRNMDDAFFKEHVNAVNSEYMRRFEDDTGQKWDSGTRRRGKPKRGTAIARQEAKEAIRIMRNQDDDQEAA